MLNNTNKTDITGIMLDNINIFLSGLSLNNFSYNLIEYIENIVEIEVITNPIAGSNAEIMLNSTFESIDALNNYQVHEEHVKVASFVRSVTCNRMCMDYEI